MANRTKRTDAREKAFLDTLRETCNVSESAKAAGVGRRTVYEWRDEDDVFRSEWDDAEQEAADRLEREAWRRAVEGTDKPVTFQGVITSSYKEYSDRMLEILLKAHRPNKFKDRAAHEHTGKDGGPISYSDMTEQELDKRLLELTQAVNGGAENG